MTIPDRESGTGVEDRQEEGGARHEMAGVHIAAMQVRRDRRKRPRLGRDSQLAAERCERDPYARPELDPIPLAGKLRDLQMAIGESSASRPKPGIEAVQPQSAVVNSRRSTWSVSPGCAPATSM